jgi:hypothetical protein
LKKERQEKGRAKTTAWKKKVKKAWGELIVDALPDKGQRGKERGISPF